MKGLKTIETRLFQFVFSILITKDYSSDLQSLLGRSWGQFSEGAIFLESIFLGVNFQGAFFWGHIFSKLSFKFCEIFQNRFSWLLLIHFQNSIIEEINPLLLLREENKNLEFFLVSKFPYLNWIQWLTLYISIFSPNTGKYGPGKTPNLDTFHVLRVNNTMIKKHTNINRYISSFSDRFLIL